MVVKVRKIKNCGNLVGSVSIEMDTEIGEVTLYGIRVLEKSNGYMVAAPSYKGSDGKYYSYYYAKDLNELKDEILDKLGQEEKKNKKWSKK